MSIGPHAVYGEEFMVQQLEEPFEIAIKDVACSAACNYDVLSESRSSWGERVLTMKSRAVQLELKQIQLRKMKWMQEIQFLA